MSVAPASVGVVGLGNMGGALASNLVRAGYTVVGHDARGSECAIDKVTSLPTVADITREAHLVVLSLPDGAASEQVALEILDAPDRRTAHVVDTSTIGVGAAQRIAERLARDGVEYVDAPVSGGPAGAAARTLVVMYAASSTACAAAEPVLAGLSDRRYRVGDRAGLGQAMKLANNFLSATALAATSEAIAFGQSQGLGMNTMLEVFSAGSGQNTATTDKFPNQVVTERYASGFANSLMAKDLDLYLEAVERLGGPSALGAITASVWAAFAEAEPGVDFTRIFPFVARS
jgi:3-hydroxyisobutyrate dehydrogenase-like beta-hydroxyacid dehydrogenase